MIYSFVSWTYMCFMLYTPKSKNEKWWANKIKSVHFIFEGAYEERHKESKKYKNKANVIIINIYKEKWVLEWLAYITIISLL